MNMGSTESMVCFVISYILLGLSQAIGFSNKIIYVVFLEIPIYGFKSLRNNTIMGIENTSKCKAFFIWDAWNLGEGVFLLPFSRETKKRFS